MHRLLIALASLLPFGACASEPASRVISAHEDDSPTPFGVALEGFPLSPFQLERATTQSGQSLRYVSFFLQWPEDPETFDSAPLVATLKTILTHGATPVVTWEPMFYTQQGQEIILPLERILDGRYDAYLDAFAQALATVDQAVILRFAHEMNLRRYHWGVSESQYNSSAPAKYQKLWKYIVTRVREAAPNASIAFAFCPNSESVPGPQTTQSDAWNTFEAYYPGDTWVDLVGLDGYNWGDTQTPERHGWQSHWRSFRAIFEEPVKSLRALAPKKPLLIFETASARSGGDRSQWVSGAFATADEWELDGLIWFQANKEVDWRLLQAAP